MKGLLYTGFGFNDILLAAMMAVCIYTDIKSRRIYNKVLIPFLAAGLTAGFLAGGWHGLLDGVKGLIAGLVMLIIPFARGGVGGGDVKLLAVVGGIKGPSFVISTFLAGALAGGIMALGLLLWHRRLLSTLAAGLGTASGFLSRYGIVLRTPESRDEEATPLHLPYSLAIGAGVAASYAAFLQAVVR